ncbi:HAMP domain-containing protein [Methyloterricola oryzae]|uniref:HAMP domain-containing protein n=1 Tax=Methyloterricola oryzae TaxID=1495050 RepID=UPI0005EB726D|nr:HAMP domain-containing protein [Methyloterricola oryzae]
MNQPVVNKRRTVFIQRAFQGRFIAWMLVMILLFAVCSAFILYLLLASDLQSEARSAHLRIADTWQKLGTSIVIGNLVSAVFAGICVAVVVLYISHKIAGPMYRFQKLFGEVGRGNLDLRASLREHDQMKELAAAFDDMLEALRRQREERAAAVRDAAAAVQQLQALYPGESSAALARIQARLEELQEKDTNAGPSV